jgi:hypothetical protein
LPFAIYERINKNIPKKYSPIKVFSFLNSRKAEEKRAAECNREGERERERPSKVQDVSYGYDVIWWRSVDDVRDTPSTLAVNDYITLRYLNKRGC